MSKFDLDISQARRIISLLMIAAGLVLFTAGLRSLYYRHYLLPQSQNQQIESLPIARESLPININIENLVDISIQPTTTDENGVPAILPDTASFLISSAQPFENGNTIIYGHNTADILGNLPKLSGDEVITLTLNNGEQRWYKIKSMQQVTPEQTEPLYPTDSEILTVYTCDGWADQNRFVVQAAPI